MNATLDHDLLHRLLDEAFAPYPATAETLDLKHEVRANLTARVAELQASGAKPGDAARTAIAELGDIGALLGDPSDATDSWVAEERRNRVRPKPLYAVRTVLLAGLFAVDVVLLVLQYASVIPADYGWILPQLVAAVVLVGVIVTDALRQETTVHFPVPRLRALGFGVASALLVVAAAAALQALQGVNTAWVVIIGGCMVVAVALFTVLGVTATNRTKPWAVRLQATQSYIPDRFEKDPATAARYGIYTAIIVTLALAAFAVLTLTVGWMWSWLALVAGFLVMLLVLARMLFAGSTPAE